MDVHTGLERLEAQGPSAVALGEPSDVPRSVPEALAEWLASVPVRPGLTAAPVPSVLVCIFTAYAEARGWEADVDARSVGRAFARLGCVRGRTQEGFLVNREAAAALWRALGGKPRPASRARRPRKTPPKPKPPRVTRHPSKPLRACDGRMWRSQRDAMATLGVTALAVSRAVHSGGTVGGVHVRFATPDEVRAWRALEEEWDGGIGCPS